MKRILQLALLLLLPVMVWAQTYPPVGVYGPVGSKGSGFPTIFPVIITIPSDADYTMAYPDMSGSSGMLQVTCAVSLSVQRNVIVQTIFGFWWLVENLCNKPIYLEESTGTGVQILSGYAQIVGCDGTHCFTTPQGSGGTVLSVVGTAPVSCTGGANVTCAMAQANGSTDGYLSHIDWSTFNGKQNALGFTPAHSGANSDITSLTGLTTPLPTTEGGSGTAGGTGYRYGNGASPDTYSTTLPSNSSQVILLPAYNLGDIVGPATFYISSYGVGSNGDEVTDNNNFKMPMAGTASNLYVGTSQAIPGGTTIVITLQKNTTDTSLTCTLSADAQTTDLVHTVSVAAGDSLQFKVVASGNVAIANWLVIGFVYGTATPPLEDY